MHSTSAAQARWLSNTDPRVWLATGALIGGVALALVPPSRSSEVLATLPFGAALLAGIMKSGTA